MSTKIFKKVKGLACAFSAGVIAFCAFFSLRVVGAREVSWQKSFYFLVSTDSRVEVSAEFTKLEGGAGYLLTEKDGQYVALSVYLTEGDGLAVQAGLEEGSTRLLRKGISSLYFKGKDKKKSALYRNALRILEGYICVLEECISRLEKGATQESCKRILQILRRQFVFAEKEYAEYPAFSLSCGEWAKELEKIDEETVYAKDLRYLLCWQAERYLQLCEDFCL